MTTTTTVNSETVNSRTVNNTMSVRHAVLPPKYIPDVRLGDVDVQGRQPVDHRVPGESQAVADHVLGRGERLQVSGVQLEHLVHQDLLSLRVRLSKESKQSTRAGGIRAGKHVPPSRRDTRHVHVAAKAGVLTPPLTT